MWYSQRQPGDHTPQPPSSTSEKTFKPKSRFLPLSNNPSLVAFTKKVDYDIKKLFDEPLPPPQSHSLTPPERTALNDLQNNKDIIIKRADKGGAVVVWGYAKYVLEANRQLQDTQYYRPTELSSKPFLQMKEELTALLHRAKDCGWINTHEYGFLLCEHPRIATFYMLPKVHKKPKDNPPGRPIISANGTLTEPASQFIDYYLNLMFISYLHM